MDINNKIKKLRKDIIQLEKNIYGFNKYLNGKIYKIRIGKYFYIGSTCRTLKRRLQMHLYNYKIENSKFYNFIKKNKGLKISIQLLKNYPCNDRTELIKEEDIYINEALKNEFCLNSNNGVLTCENRKKQNKYNCN